jgi:hypothetical protein
VSTDDSTLGSTRAEAERLVAAALGAVSTALHGMEVNRQLRAFAEQMLSDDRVRDLTAGLGGFMSGGAMSGGSAAADGAGSPGSDGAGAGSPGTDGAGAGSPGTDGAGAGWPRFATGSADCCVCPVCRLIAALRNPSPEFAERLASAAGDLAVGLAGLLRALGGVLAAPGHGSAGDPWRSATAGGSTSHGDPTGASASSGRGGTQTASAPSGGPYQGTAPNRTADDVSDSPTPERPDTARKPVAKKAAKRAVHKVPGGVAGGRRGRVPGGGTA